ncbi:MAG: glycoside hydrolase family 108 protein [Syntrophobacteraceae bacterium]
MDERFEQCGRLVLRHEGGLVNHPQDPGGITNFGVSLRYLKKLGVIDPLDGYLYGDMDHDGDIDAEDIKKMTQDEALRIYKAQWWDRYKYGQICYLPTAAKVFDFAVNAGPVRAGICLQKVLNKYWLAKLKQDGVIGPLTLVAINAILNPQYLLAVFKLEIIRFYASLDKMVFLDGWVNRALDDLPEAV